MFDATPNCNLPYECTHISTTLISSTWYTSELTLCYGFPSYFPRKIFNFYIEYKEYKRLPHIVYCKITDLDSMRTANGWLFRTTLDIFDNENLNISSLIEVDPAWHHFKIHNISYHIHLSFILAAFDGFSHNIPVLDDCDVSLELFDFKPHKISQLMGVGNFNSRALNPHTHRYADYVKEFYVPVPSNVIPFVAPVVSVGVVGSTFAALDRILEKFLNSISALIKTLVLDLVKLFGEIIRIVLDLIVEILSDDNFKNVVRDIMSLSLKFLQEVIIFFDTIFPLFEILLVSVAVHYKFKSYYITFVSLIPLIAIAPTFERKVTVLTVLRKYCSDLYNHGTISHEEL